MIGRQLSGRLGEISVLEETHLKRFSRLLLFDGNLRGQRLQRAARLRSVRDATRRCGQPDCSSASDMADRTSTCGPSSVASRWQRWHGRIATAADGIIMSSGKSPTRTATCNRLNVQHYSDSLPYALGVSSPYAAVAFILSSIVFFDCGPGNIDVSETEIFKSQEPYHSSIPLRCSRLMREQAPAP